MIRRRVIVSGHVQGVFFRDTCRRVAHGLGVRGWIRNLSDGRVEAAFEGAPAAVARVLEWVYYGPPGAVVDAVDVYDEEVEGLKSFLIQPTR